LHPYIYIYIYIISLSPVGLLRRTLGHDYHLHWGRSTWSQRFQSQIQTTEASGSNRESIPLEESRVSDPLPMLPTLLRENKTTTWWFLSPLHNVVLLSPLFIDRGDTILRNSEAVNTLILFLNPSLLKNFMSQCGLYLIFQTPLSHERASDSFCLCELLVQSKFQNDVVMASGEACQIKNHCQRPCHPRRPQIGEIRFQSFVKSELNLLLNFVSSLSLCRLKISSFSSRMILPRKPSLMWSSDLFKVLTSP